MRRSERTSAGRLGGGESARATPSLFQFRLVDRLQCQQSGTVKYTTQPADNMLSLQVGVMPRDVWCLAVDVSSCRAVAVNWRGDVWFGSHYVSRSIPHSRNSHFWDALLVVYVLQNNVIRTYRVVESGSRLPKAL